MADARFYRFGPFRFDAAGRILFRDGKAVPLPPKAAETLLVLVEHPGRVVEKSELLKTVWEGAFIEEGSLTRSISVLRKALGAGGPQYIATISKRGYRFVAPVESGGEEEPHSAIRKVMIAVLPFQNLNNDKSQEYFSDGLTEEMITQLGRLNPERLGVIARTSAMQYKSTGKTIEQIGRELRVAYVLEGSARREKRRVRITAQLIQVSDQTHLWADTYERDLKDILRLQSEVSQAIAEQIQVQLLPFEQKRLKTARQVNPTAFEAYLKGRYLWNRRSHDDLKMSLRCFHRAIKTDPGYAAAYAGLADTYLSLLDGGYLLPLAATAKAREAAFKALSIDKELAEPHVSLGHACLHDFNWSEAETEFRRGIDLNPSYSVAHFYYSNYLVIQRRFGEAMAEAQRARMLDPALTAPVANLAAILFLAGDYRGSIEQSQRVLAMDPNNARAYEDLGRAYEQLRDHTTAITAFRKAVAVSKRFPGYLASLSHGYARAGQKAKARALLAELKRKAQKEYVSPFALALVYTGLDDFDQAFLWLEKAFVERSNAVPFVHVNPRLAALRSDSRFKALLERIGVS